MPETLHCPECGSELPPGLPIGLCPRCALQAASAELHNQSQIVPEVSTALAQAGDFVGRYKLLQQIGEGGCGVVFMAEQSEPIRRKVALKIVKLGMDTKSVIARFEAERQALALMDHPNIAKVFDAGATDTGRPYFVMELVRGVKITDYCDQHRLTTRARLDLFMQVCHAIQHAHQKGIIHRDIKPSNILVTLHDGAPVPKIIDFGIAKATSGQRLTDKTLFTAFEQFMGTPAYMSPEQAEMSALDIDTRSDIYSLGVLLYELLTGKTPFDGKQLLESGLDAMRHTIREQEPAKPSTRLSTMTEADRTQSAEHRQTEPNKLRTFLRGDLDWIVMKALEKDRSRRYETANGLALDIQRHLNNEPIRARPTRRVEKLRRWCRRNPAGAGFVGALILGFAALTALVKVMYDRGNERDQEVMILGALVARNIDALWKREDKTQEHITSEELAALAGKRKKRAPGNVLRLKVGLGATVTPVDRARTHQSALDFLERRMTAALGREVRLDLVIFKDMRLDQHMAGGHLHLARMGALAFIKAREANPNLVPLAQENSPKDAVVFVLKSSGITNLFQIRSIAFADTNSTISAWAKVFLVRTGIHGADLNYYSNLQSAVEDRDIDYHAHKEALEAVRELRFDAAVSRPHHVEEALGPEGTNWIALLRFESSQTIWAAGSGLEPDVRAALSNALDALAQLSATEQEKLKLDPRMRKLVPIDKKLLKELEDALERDLRLFERPPAPDSGSRKTSP